MRKPNKNKMAGVNSHFASVSESIFNGFLLKIGKIHLRRLENVDHYGQIFIFFSNQSLCSGFSFVIVLTMINEVSDFRVLLDSKINYKFIFCRRCSRRRRRGFVNSLLCLVASYSVLCKMGHSVISLLW